MSGEEDVVIPDYSVRPMTRCEIPQVLQLWRETGLSEGTYSLDTWFDHDPQGFYVAATEDGLVLGACAGVLQHEDLAFIGLYVVKKEYQRRGIGRKIWDAVMTRVGDRDVGVNPVPAQLENYRDRANFPIQTGWNTVVYECACPDMNLFNPDNPDIEVRKVSPKDEALIQQIVEYDAGVCGFERGNLIPLLAGQKESVTLVTVRARDDSVCGYGNIRVNIKGNALVGPLYADDLDVAEKLLFELVKSLPVAETLGFQLMGVDVNKECKELAERLGMKERFSIARLYRIQDLEMRLEKVFSQHNLNFSVI